MAKNSRFGNKKATIHSSENELNASKTVLTEEFHFRGVSPTTPIPHGRRRIPIPLLGVSLPGIRGYPYLYSGYPFWVSGDTHTPTRGIPSGCQGIPIRLLGVSLPGVRGYPYAYSGYPFRV